MLNRDRTASKSGGYKVHTAARRSSFRPLLELLEARQLLASDFGDAPLPYPTLLAEGGSEHVAIGPMLGATRDTEADGAHSAGANGDDTTGIDDEDGVTFGEIRTGALGATATVTICCGPSKLDAWIDFNGDGSWGGPGEQIADTVSVDPGDNVISFDVPSWAVDGTTIARFRLSTGGNLGVGGVAADGETEDYGITVLPPTVACGCFQERGVNYAAVGASDVHAADVDGDGDIDVLSASFIDDKIAWYENSGNQSFIPRTISMAANGAKSVFAADVDTDGDMDVLSASYADDKIAWYENNGSQNFNPRTITTAANSAKSVFATDVDGDGDTDVLSASYFEIAWYENDGGQNFTIHVISTAVVDALSVYAADVDSDGDTDVLSTSHYDNKIAWYENNGNQTFIDHTISANASGAVDVYAVDLDADGDIDVLSASAHNNTIAWYENNGNEEFIFHPVGFATSAWSVYAADVDGDGDIDVLSASRQSSKIQWHENDGSQSFTAHVIGLPAKEALSVFAADLDNDGDMDALSASLSDNKIAWYENDGSENFATHPINFPLRGAYDVHAADMDNDGDMDALSASLFDDQIVWYENDGEENFFAHLISTFANKPESVDAADVDGDGDMDVLSASIYDDLIAWYENDGNQNFSVRIITAAADGARGVLAADIDGDGDTDVIATSSYDDKVLWYENDGDQDFTEHTVASGADRPLNVFAADLDADGDTDILSASDVDDKVAWYENDGSQNFTAHTITNSADGAFDVLALDFDGDGDIDVLSASAGDDKIVWHENDGFQTFTAHTIATTTDGVRSISAADLDGDGDVDVTSASFWDHKISWYENDGNQNFVAHVVSTMARGARDVVTADVDQDGDIDILSASFNDDKIAWYENLNFLVVNTNDSGPGSLRRAIQQANSNPGVDTITFAIGSGYQTIAPTSALPTITDAVIIDGTTQPGYAGSSLIEVWGLAAGPNVHGLVIAADDSTVKGLVVNLFSGNGILITGNNNRIENSYIGTDVSGTIAVPNALNGVEISGGSNNIIGGTDPGTANIIAFNGGQGVLVDTGAGNAIRRNSIHSNDGFGIGLINGGNNNQAAPTVTRWTSVGGTTKVWINLTSTPSTTFSIDVFRNAACDPSGFGEGEMFLGTVTLTTGADGIGSVIAVFGIGTPLNQFITATASIHHTSEFSNCRPFRLKAPFTADSIPPLPIPPLPPPGGSVVTKGAQWEDGPDPALAPSAFPAAPNPGRNVHRHTPILDDSVRNKSAPIDEVIRPPYVRRITRLAQSTSADLLRLDAMFSVTTLEGSLAWPER